MDEIGTVVGRERGSAELRVDYSVTEVRVRLSDLAIVIPVADFRGPIDPGDGPCFREGLALDSEKAAEEARLREGLVNRFAEAATKLVAKKIAEHRADIDRAIEKVREYARTGIML